MEADVRRNEDVTYKMSRQMLVTLMLVLQKCLAEQSDIVPILENLDLYINSDNTVWVQNPPVVKAAFPTVTDLHATVDDDKPAVKPTRRPKKKEQEEVIYKVD